MSISLLKIAASGTGARCFGLSVLLSLFGLVIASPAKAEDNWAFATGGSVPVDAIAGGQDTDGTLLYICRANFQGGLHPGRVKPGLAGCDIGWGGTERLISFYQVLVPRWASASNGNIPSGAYSYGFEASAPGDFFGPPLYACRGSVSGSLHPGKVRPGFNGCHVGWGGQELEINPYEVLIAGPFNQLPVKNYNLGSGNIPFRLGPIAGGFEASGEALYVCLGSFNQGEHPGKTRPGLGGCNIGWGGAEQSVPLQNSSALILNWMRPSPGLYLSFQAGNEAYGEPLYICTANVNGASYPGKYSSLFNACSVGLNGGEYMANDFAILTDNQQIPR